MIVKLKLKSKKKLSLEKFTAWFKRFRKTKTTVKFRKIKKHKRVVTVLKSPHIYKSAQEQFSIFNFQSLLTIEVLNFFQFLFFFKQFQLFNFPDINFVCKIDFNNFFKKKIFLSSTTKILNYIRILEIEGCIKDRF